MCTFPSKELFDERRRMVELADKSQDAELINNCAQFVLRCDQLRLLHEEITGCRCWYALKCEYVAA